MKNKVILIITVLLISCELPSIDDSVDLGNRYRYIRDSPKTIIYHREENYNGMGVEIIPPTVLSYKFDDRYIIVKSQKADETTGSTKGKPVLYWIIDKESNGAKVNPMDSIIFINEKTRLGVNLNF